MPEKFFQAEQAKKDNNINPELQNKISQAEERLAVLAQLVGGDFKMSVKFGELGKGSFYNPESASITLDPQILAEGKDWLPEFVAGHEGGHRAITRSLEQIGVKQEKALELYKKLGFGYLSNCLEDCADNDWVSSVFPKFKEDADENYQESFNRENTVLSTPEIDQIISQLGYVPKFVNYGSEIIRKWATGKYSKDLDASVAEALRQTKDDCANAWENIPGKYAKESERSASARQRFKIIYEKVLPEFEKLVKMDIDDEKLRELANQLAQAEQKERGEMGEPGSAWDSLPDAMKEELRKALEKNLQKQLESLNMQMDEINKKLSQPGLSAKEKQELQDQIKALAADQEAMRSGENNIIPWDQLSAELKEKLKDIYNKLPQEIRQDLQAKAEQTLKELDDKLIKASRGKLQKDGRPLTHEEAEKMQAQINEAKSEAREKAKGREQEEKENESLQSEIKARQEGDLSEYDRVYKEVAPLIDELYNRIQKIFLPMRHPRWQKGHPTGHRLDLAKAMQFQADKSLYDKIWERKSTPHKIDYRFTLLVDLSGSMSGEKVKQTFKGVIVLAEVLNRLDIKTEILGFQDTNILYKDFKQELGPAIRRKMAIMRNEVDNNGEHNQSSYNSDGFCLKDASERLNENKGKDNFLIVLSDGLPEPDPAHTGAKYDLHKVVADIRKNTKQRLIGIGLGSGTEHVKDYYPTSLPSLPLEKMPELLGDLLEDMIAFPAKYK